MKIISQNLKLSLTLMVIAVIIILTVSTIWISYETAYNSLFNSYLNQLDNFNLSISREFENFFEDEQKLPQ